MLRIAVLIAFSGPPPIMADEVPSQPPPEATPKEEAPPADPCVPPELPRSEWIDRLQRGVFRTVCGTVAWFDGFFGEGTPYDSRELYGRVGVGMLYRTNGEWDARSRFDANIPLPNLDERMNAFLKRDDESDSITEENEGVVIPTAFRRETSDSSWLAGFGYAPPGRAGDHLKFRLGAKVSTHPYAFAQGRYRLNHYLSNRAALRFTETVFLRSNEDEYGSTTQLSLDWIPASGYLFRATSSATITRDTDGFKWQSFVTLYQDLGRSTGKPRGLSVQYLIRGETASDVPVAEYGLLSVYREQMFRPWLFGEVTFGYTWTRDLPTDPREGAVNVGFVLEMLFGNVPGDWKGIR